MKYKKRSKEKIDKEIPQQSEREFINSANKGKVRPEVKNFNIRFSPDELEKLRETASRNRRSMQQQVKHIFESYFESGRG